VRQRQTNFKKGSAQGRKTNSGPKKEENGEGLGLISGQRQGGGRTWLGRCSGGELNRQRNSEKSQGEALGKTGLQGSIVARGGCSGGKESGGRKKRFEL